MVAGTDLIEYAKTFLGTPYEFGATGPGKFDCSGFADYVYKHFGLSLPRTTAQMQAGDGGLMTIAENQLQAGDLILSKGWSPNNPNQGHVGLYMGNGKLIEAGSSGVAVTTFGPTYHSHVTGFRRAPGMPGYTGAAPGTNTADGADSSWLDTLKSWIVGGATTALNVKIPVVSDVTSALTVIGQTVAGVATGIGTIAGLWSRLFLPTSIMRAILMIWGTIFILIGIWFLASEAKES